MNKKQASDMAEENNAREAEDIKITINRDHETLQPDQASEEKPMEKLTKEELREKLKKVEQEKQTNFDLYLRAQAEMENMKKRAKKEKEDWLRYANETLIKELLPVMDNLENAITHSNSEHSFDALREGVELTLKGMKDSLMKSGVEEVKAQGEAFDPCFHEAVSELEDVSVKSGTVIHELQKGYLLNQRLIRPAKVVVSRGGGDDTAGYDNESTEGICENK
ncbi:MAG: nucleotide exchange factor GrpE [Desulfatiglandales bacterium]